MSNSLSKKRLGIFSLTCCEGCQFSLLKDYIQFQKVLEYYDIINFRLAQEDNLPGPYDICLVEGTPESEREIELLKKIRKESKTIIAIGSCAILGGIQSERDRLPQKLTGRNKVRTPSDIIKIDYIIPGCPIGNEETINYLLGLYFGKSIALPDYSVCFECRQNENECLLKNKKPCLGPITRGGCNSVCINGGEACLGCRGATDQANFGKLREMLKPLIDNEEIKNMLTIYGDYEQDLKDRHDTK